MDCTFLLAAVTTHRYTHTGHSFTGPAQGTAPKTLESGSDVCCVARTTTV